MLSTLARLVAIGGLVLATLTVPLAVASPAAADDPTDPFPHTSSIMSGIKKLKFW